MLQSVGLQRVRHDSAAEQQQTQTLVGWNRKLKEFPQKKRKRNRK